MKNHIKKYNDFLKTKKSNFIDNTDFQMEGLLSDHHHMNAIGHHFIFEKLSTIILKYMKENKVSE